MFLWTLMRHSSQRQWVNTSQLVWPCLMVLYLAPWVHLIAHRSFLLVPDYRRTAFSQVVSLWIFMILWDWKKTEILNYKVIQERTRFIDVMSIRLLHKNYWICQQFKKGNVEVWQNSVNLLYVWRTFTRGPRGRANGGPKNDEAAVTLHTLPKDKKNEWPPQTEMSVRTSPSCAENPGCVAANALRGEAGRTSWFILLAEGPLDIFPRLPWCSGCCCPSQRPGSSVSAIACSHWRCDI